MRSFSVLTASVRRALALVLGCVLALSWVGSANAMCAMAAGDPMSAAVGTAVGAPMPHGMRMTAASGHAMDAAVVEHAPAPRSRGATPADDGCPMHGRGNSPCTVPTASQTSHDGLHGLTLVHAAGDAPAPGHSTGSMPADCAVAAHCAALTAATVAPGVATDAATTRVPRVSADGPLLGASEAAAEPTAPPPRG